MTKICSICQSQIFQGEPGQSCPDCALPFHAECWEENGGCSQYGCPSAPKNSKEPPAPLPETGAWGREKECPACGRQIKSDAIKCRHCGATFSTREAISREAFLRREYEGNEYVTARNSVIGLFFLCATGCLSPLGIILAGLLLFKGAALKIEYRRLPMALRVLVACSFGVSALLTLLMMALWVLD